MGHGPFCGALAATLMLAACGTPAHADGWRGGRHLPQLGAATGAPLALACADLAAVSLDDTVLTATQTVAAGTPVGGLPVGEHCLVTGKMHERVSPVDGQTYAIGFQMRLPKDWNGRFFHQGNGGLDGIVSPAAGAVSGGGPRTHALAQGFAVLSSDAGHSIPQLPLFGLDPQARLDYGYQAAAKLTPMAKSLIRAAYGKGPDRSYFGGGSNGGRHTMVAAARNPDEYDGYLATAPGFNLPKAAVAQLYGAQQYLTVATNPADLSTAFTPAEREFVAKRVLERCDHLDGLADGLVQDFETCRHVFRLERDVPTCSAARDGKCLSDAQKRAIGNVFAGARNSRGEALYAPFPYDSGIANSDWASWEFVASVTNRDPVAVGFVFQTPPAPASMLNDLMGFVRGFDMDADAPKIHATDATYTESSMSFMTPPNPTRLDRLRERGAKMIVVHGASDAVFSVLDTTDWYRRLDAAHRQRADEFVRLFVVPGMGHVRGGRATDQFDALTPLVAWVEQGIAPQRIVAGARGAGNAYGVNPELPADWSPTRSRPLCPYPTIARYRQGNPELESSFMCR